MEKLETKGHTDSLTIDLLKKDLAQRSSYKDLNRIYGAGELRLGTNIELTPGIYSLSFSCQVKDEIMRKYFDIFLGKHKEEK